MSFETSNPLFLTATPPIGGQIKSRVEDFRVEEIPAYQPCGEGLHWFLWIEKKMVSTPFLVQQLAAQLGINEYDIGVAGRKDRQAVTRQFVSIPDAGFSADELETLSIEHVRVHSATRHSNKLKTGHLLGNRFEITVRGVVHDALKIAKVTADQINQYGFPNWYGEQRFGVRNDTDELGFQLLRGETRRRVSGNRLRFCLSAAQSRLFNTWLGYRLQDGLAREVIAGDVMQFNSSRGVFIAEDIPSEQARFDQAETVPTGPMFGPKMKNAEKTAQEREAAVLAEFDLPRDAFGKYRKLTSGTRRRMMVRAQDLSVREVEADLCFTFVLPPGCYATALMNEFIKLR